MSPVVVFWGSLRLSQRNEDKLTPLCTCLPLCAHPTMLIPSCCSAFYALPFILTLVNDSGDLMKRWNIIKLLFQFTLLAAIHLIKETNSCAVVTVLLNTNYHLFDIFPIAPVWVINTWNPVFLLTHPTRRFLDILLFFPHISLLVIPLNF